MSDTTNEPIRTDAEERFLEHDALAEPEHQTEEHSLGGANDFTDRREDVC